MKRGTLWLWRLLVAAAALVLALSLGSSSAWRIAAEHPQWLVPALAGWLVNQVMCALRFRILATSAGVPISFVQSFRMQLVGFLVGCIFGGFAANDVARLVWLRQSATDTRLGSIVALILLDRALGVLAFGAWAFALSFAVPAQAAGAAALVDIVRAAFVALLAGAAATAFAVRTVARAQGAGNGWVERLRAAAALASQPSVVAGLLRALPFALGAAGAVILAQGFLGTQVTHALGSASPFLLQCFLAPASIVVSILPLVPVGLGLSQLTLSGLYALFGLALDAAVVLTSVMQLGQIGVALGVGAPLLASIRRSPVEARSITPK